MDMRDRLRLVMLFQDTKCKHRFIDNADMIDLVDYLIENDVQIVRHGKWEYIGTDKHGNVFRCSHCALRIGLDYETTYCPHCGAKMDLEE